MKYCTQSKQVIHEFTNSGYDVTKIDYFDNSIDDMVINSEPNGKGFLTINGQKYDLQSPDGKRTEYYKRYLQPELDERDDMINNGQSNGIGKFYIIQNLKLNKEMSVKQFALASISYRMY